MNANIAKSSHLPVSLLQWPIPHRNPNSWNTYSHQTFLFTLPHLFTHLLIACSSASSNSNNNCIWTHTLQKASCHNRASVNLYKSLGHSHFRVALVSSAVQTQGPWGAGWWCRWDPLQEAGSFVCKARSSHTWWQSGQTVAKSGGGDERWCHQFSGTSVALAGHCYTSPSRACSRCKHTLAEGRLSQTKAACSPENPWCHERLKEQLWEKHGLGCRLSRWPALPWLTSFNVELQATWHNLLISIPFPEGEGWLWYIW